MLPKCSFIGAGNLATNLAFALFESGYEICEIYSRTEESAKSLACLVNSTHTTNLEKLELNADIYFVALKDDAINEILQKIDWDNKLIVHCSGSLPMDVLSSFSDNTGVFYPLQTFSKNRKVSFMEIPVFIESSDSDNEKKLVELARNISENVFVMNSEQRKYLHVSAVFACNFVNHFYTIGSEILKKNNIPFEVLRPLILETALKVQEMDPEKAQTGPAVRFDQTIVSKHLQLLEGIGNYSELYNSVTKSIFDFHKNKTNGFF